MRTVLRPFDDADLDKVVELALRAWEPVHRSMAEVMGAGINARVYPDWAASQEDDVRRACLDPEQLVTVATDAAATLLGFVTVVIDAPKETGEIYMIAVDPPVQRRGLARALTDHAIGQMRAAGCRLAVVATGGDAGHAPARGLYESAGFTALPLVNYYRELA
jgi:ribosomal protein S18 acetylase RimI-like enzyme